MRQRRKKSPFEAFPRETACLSLAARTEKNKKRGIKSDEGRNQAPQKNGNKRGQALSSEKLKYRVQVRSGIKLCEIKMWGVSEDGY